VEGDDLETSLPASYVRLRRWRPAVGSTRTPASIEAEARSSSSPSVAGCLCTLPPLVHPRDDLAEHLSQVSQPS